MNWLALCLLALLAMVPAVVSYTPDKDPASSQISPAVFLMNEDDWKLSFGPDGKPSSRCLDMVARAREFSNGNRLSFVPTFHWLPGLNNLGVNSFCLMASNNTNGPACVPWTPEKVADFKQSMTLCFMEAFSHGFVVYVRPNLEDGLGR